MGIGEAIASALVEAGANVILFSRSEVNHYESMMFQTSAMPANIVHV